MDQETTRPRWRTIRTALAIVGLLAPQLQAQSVAPGEDQAFAATAYCTRGITKSGVRAQRGVAAADPDVLPVGSVVRVSADGIEHDGIYTVMDTGAKVIGRRIDLYVSDCERARRFGMQQVLLRVLRLGWNPSASAGRTPRAVALRSVVDEARPAVLLAGAPSPDDLSDGAITAKVKSRLARDETIRSRDIHVATKDAVVTLSGHVTTEAERETAVKLARETEGVKSVVDRLEVKKAA